jgi:hypothetical protein
MKATIRRIEIFGLARDAHRESPHRRVVAIIRDVLNNRKAWPTVDTVDKRVVIAPVNWIKQFVEAVLASGNIGCNRDEGLTSGSALDDAKVAIVYQLHMVATLDGIDEGKGRRIRSEIVDESLDGAAITFDINQHASRGIANLASQSSPFSK